MPVQCGKNLALKIGYLWLGIFFLILFLVLRFHRGVVCISLDNSDVCHFDDNSLVNKHGSFQPMVQ